jgi:hypothetical protein
MSLNRPSFNGRPIASVESLGRALGVDARKLVSMSRCSDDLYLRSIWIHKRGRKPRAVFPASPALRDIHQRILDRILRRAALPPYLMGGITGRSYIGNARVHSSAKVLLGGDVDAFYPSISTHRVECIFQDVFHFPSHIARLLAKLCTRRGELVQGGVASTHIANLALYRREPDLFKETQRQGLTYTRFVDDMHMSSQCRRAPRAVTRAMTMMRQMMEREGFRPKRSKQFVARSSRPMQVHRLNVNSSASSPQSYRRSLRNELFLLEKWTTMQPWDAAMERAYLRISARVGQLKHLNPGVARSLRARLVALAPLRIGSTGSMHNAA